MSEAEVTESVRYLADRIVDFDVAMHIRRLIATARKAGELQAVVDKLREALEKIAKHQPSRHIDEEQEKDYVDCVGCESVMGIAAAALAPSTSETRSRATDGRDKRIIR